MDTHSPTSSHTTDESTSPAVTELQELPLAPAPSPGAENQDTIHKCPAHKTVEKCKDPGLTGYQRDEITSKLLDSTLITFHDEKAQIRNKTQGRSKMLPEYFWRTFYETSVTLSSRVSKDTHVKHRERADLKIGPGLAFQAVGEVSFARDVTKERVERHLIWNKKKDPSSWISVFDDLSHAERRADFHYDQSHRIGHRVSIAQISTQDLVAATVTGLCQTTWKVFTRSPPLGEKVDCKEWDRAVDIPVWVSSHAIPKDGSPLTMAQFKDSGAELWVSITELRASSLKDGAQTHGPRRMIMAKGHDYEWLALGCIPESRIIRVMPFDGKTLHWKKGPSTVWSQDSPEPWIYDWDLQSWRLDPILFAQAKYPEEHPVITKTNKRQRTDDGVTTHMKSSASPNGKQTLTFSTIVTVAHCFI